MKLEQSAVDGTPHKRLFWSIISDYGFETAILELVDNSIDVWMQSGRARDLCVTIEADFDRQIISVTDNAGGVATENIGLLVTPGGSDNDPDGNSIGVFGVGSKRAVVALGEQISIKTRRFGHVTSQIDITSDWIASPDWTLPRYEVDNIEEGNTIVHVSMLRFAINEHDVTDLKLTLAETYANFLNLGNCVIKVNDDAITPIAFNTFAFPDDFRPSETVISIFPDGVSEVLVTIQAGLIWDRDPVEENYGVYIYCNKRLIVKALRTRDVGYFVSSEAGTPHPDASLCRVIVEFDGPAKLMPWNSNKSGILPRHPTFQRISKTIVALCTTYTRISRSTKNTWEEKVFPFKAGTFDVISEEAATTGRKLVLPKVPKSNKSKVEHLMAANATVTASKPYLIGLLEGIAAADLILSKRYETANRIALILIDATFEIAMKEWMVHNKSLYGTIPLIAVFKDRTSTIFHFSKHADITQDILDIPIHFQDHRNKMIPERATFSVSNQDIQRYRSAVCKILTKLYNIKWP